MHADLGTVIESLELALNTELRVLETITERAQGKGDLELQEAGYRRSHRLRALIFGTPPGLTAIKAEDLKALPSLDTLSQDVRSRLAAIYKPKHLTKEDLANLNKVIFLDQLLTKIRNIQTSLAAREINPPVTHPLYIEWSSSLEKASSLHKRPSAFIGALKDIDNALRSQSAGFYSGYALVAFLIGLAASVMFPDALGAWRTPSAFGAALGLAGLFYYAIGLERKASQLSPWPATLVNRAVELGARDELERLASWFFRGDLKIRDINNLARCLDVREAMSSSVYSDSTEEEKTPHKTTAEASGIPPSNADHPPLRTPRRASVGTPIQPSR